MAQADLYLQQGLVRIARRLLENLRFRYPEDPQIARKIAVIDEVRTHIDEDEIRRRVEKTTILEAQLREKAARKKAGDKKAEEIPADPRKDEKTSAAVPPPASAPDPAKPAPPKTEEKARPTGPFKAEVLEGEKVSTVDLFAETDIIPFIPEPPVERKYYDLRAAATDELAWLAAARTRQLAGEASPLERALSGIVSEFRKDLKARTDPDAETHYQLGLAFMGQGLIPEAVEELTEAARDKRLALDSYSLIGQCYRQIRDFDEAAKWVAKAMAEAQAGTEPYYALAFELAETKEAAEDRAAALALFREIHAWNPGYRDVASRMGSLEIKPPR
jgi:hypothetical protein